MAQIQPHYIYINRYMLNKRLHLLLLFSALLLQAGFTRCYLPVSHWLTPEAIYTDDYSLHYADALYKSALWQQNGFPFGYNTATRAGTASGAIFTVDNYGWSLFVYALSAVIAPGLAFKLFFILGMLLLPLLLYWSGVNVGLSRMERALCALLGTFFLHVSICVDFLYWGSFSYILSCFAAVYISSLYYKYTATGRLRDLLMFTLVFAAGFWVHLFTAVQAALPLALCWLARLPRLTVKQHLLSAAAIVLVVFLNSVWFIPCVVFMSGYIDSSRDHFFYTTDSIMEPLKTYLFFDIKFNEYLGIPFRKNGIVDFALLLLGGVGFSAWKRSGAAARLLVFSGSVAGFFLLAYYGSFWHVTAGLTPLRFVIFMNLLLCIPAAAGLMALYRLFLADRPLRVRALTLLAVCYLVGSLLLEPYTHLYLERNFRLMPELPPQLHELSSWITSSTDSSGRILIENSDFETGHRYYGTHFPFMLPLETGREYIGNYGIYTTSPDVFSTFGPGMLFQKRIFQHDPDELWNYMGLYNIRWIVVWSDDSQRFFASDTDHYRFITRIDHFFVFEALREGSFFLKGSGTIQARPNRIELSDLSPENGEVVLSYHWMKYLKSSCGLPVEQTAQLADPVGFITLKNPPRQLTITTDFPGIFLDGVTLRWLSRGSGKQVQK